VQGGKLAGISIEQGMYMLDLEFLDLHPFFMLKLKGGKKPGEKRWEYEKGRKKGYCERA
jgi:hypothetical protein